MRLATYRLINYLAPCAQVLHTFAGLFVSCIYMYLNRLPKGGEEGQCIGQKALNLVYMGSRRSPVS